MTQQKIANAVGLSQAMISKILTGKVNISKSTADKIEKLTKVSWHKIMVMPLTDLEFLIKESLKESQNVN